MRVPRPILLLGILLVLFGFSSLSHADLLYDVTFGSPPHNPGDPPITGAGPAPRETPTNINFGDPTVVVDFEDLIDQPCRYGNGTTGYDQLQFGVGTNDPDGFPSDYDDYYFALDVVFGTFLNDIFVILFDAPTVNRLDFLSDGSIDENASGTSIGSWTAGTTVHVEIHFDIVDETWEIWLDGVSAFFGPIATDGRLRSIRLHQSGGNEANGVAVDNFILHGGQPGSGVEVDLVVPAPDLGRTLSPHPNPTSDAATLRWETTEPVVVRIEITDISGRHVWSEDVTDRQLGLHTLRWRALDPAGRSLPSGTYFVRVTARNRILGNEKIVIRR